MGGPETFRHTDRLPKDRPTGHLMTLTPPRALPLFLVLTSLSAALTSVPVRAETGAQAATPAGQAGGSTTATPRQSGTVKAITPHDFVLTTAAGQDVAITVPDKAKVLLVPPGSHDLSAAQPGTLADVTAGDRVLVNGTAGDPASMLTATRVVVMKSTAIAASHAADEAAWARGAGGLVRSVDGTTGVITVASGAHSLMVDTTPSTVVRRYAGGSVRFQDAVKSNVAAIQTGDQLRVRGQKSADGTTIVADEVVVGSFSNYSGSVSAIDPALGTVTLKDLATKKPVTVAVTQQTNLRRLPAGVMAGRSGGNGSEGGAGGAPANRAPGNAGTPGGAGGGTAGSGRSGADLSRMLNRLPTETLAGLKNGDAVIVVASNNAETGQPTAITLVVGVEQILAAAPAGNTTLSPWSLGQGEGGAEGGASQ